MHAVEVPLVVVSRPRRNTNSGFATWTYNVAEGAFDFLADGETLTRPIRGGPNNDAPNNLKRPSSRSRSRSRTNEAPTIATAGSAITERIGTAQ